MTTQLTLILFFLLVTLVPRKYSVRGGYCSLMGNGLAFFANRVLLLALPGNGCVPAGTFGLHVLCMLTRGSIVGGASAPRIPNRLIPMAQDYAHSKKVCIYRDSLCLEGFASAGSGISKPASTVRCIQKRNCERLNTESVSKHAPPAPLMFALLPVAPCSYSAWGRGRAMLERSRRFQATSANFPGRKGSLGIKLTNLP